MKLTLTVVALLAVLVVCSAGQPRGIKPKRCAQNDYQVNLAVLSNSHSQVLSDSPPLVLGNSNTSPPDEIRPWAPPPRPPYPEPMDVQGFGISYAIPLPYCIKVCVCVCVRVLACFCCVGGTPPSFMRVPPEAAGGVRVPRRAARRLLRGPSPVSLGVVCN